MELVCQIDTSDWTLLTFMLYGYSSRGDDTPPAFFTSLRHFRRVLSWLYIGKSASETGSELVSSLYISA